MANLLFIDVGGVKAYEAKPEDDFFEYVLSLRRNEVDSDSFFLEYVEPSILEAYDFSDGASALNFLLAYYRGEIPTKVIGVCNFEPQMCERNLGISGKKLSDPAKNIPGQFAVRDGVLTYSPFFDWLDEERDFVKYAFYTYLTTIPFPDLLGNQINHANSFRVHTGYTSTAAETIQNKGPLIYEEVSKEEVIAFSTNPELGRRLVKKAGR